MLPYSRYFITGDLACDWAISTQNGCLLNCIKCAVIEILRCYRMKPACYHILTFVYNSFWMRSATFCHVYVCDFPSGHRALRIVIFLMQHQPSVMKHQKAFVKISVTQLYAVFDRRARKKAAVVMGAQALLRFMMLYKRQGG